jgi:hypothetical protein
MASLAERAVQKALLERLKKRVVPELTEEMKKEDETRKEAWELWGRVAPECRKRRRPKDVGEDEVKDERDNKAEQESADAEEKMLKHEDGNDQNASQQVYAHRSDEESQEEANVPIVREDKEGNPQGAELSKDKKKERPGSRNLDDSRECFCTLPLELRLIIY